MKPQGISETKRCIVSLEITAQGDIVKIASKLPQEAEQVTGVFFSIKDLEPWTGIISLSFSEGISNPLLHQMVTTQYAKRKKTKYIPLCEPVSNACTLQGYYRDTSSIEASYTVLIYIEYIPRKRENT